MPKSQENKKQITAKDIIGLISAIIAIVNALLQMKNKNTEVKHDEKEGVSISYNDAGQLIKINGLELKEGHLEYTKKDSNFSLKIEQNETPSANTKGEK